MTTKKGGKKAAILRYLTKYPNATSSEVAKVVKCHDTYVSTIRNKPTTASKLLGEPTINMSVDVGTMPACIKILDKGRIVCTVTLKKDGMTYKPSNAKKNGDRLINWSIIQQLSKLGLL
jgi:hypothetical protein